MANRLPANRLPGPATKARRIARLIRDRVHPEQDAEREAAFGGNSMLRSAPDAQRAEHQQE